MAQNPKVNGNLPKLTAVVLTLNEAEHVTACLDSLDFADRILVFDSFSADNTADLAREAGAEVIQSDFENYAQQRNAALASVESDWVLFVDADERGTETLGQEIRQVMAQGSEAGWYIPRHNYIFGRLTKGAGWYPDYQLRLFRHGSVRYERPVHEVAVVDGTIGYLAHSLVHYNYRDLAHFHAKQRQYSRYDAGILLEEGIQPKVYTPFIQPVRHFWWRFVTLRGYRDAMHGFRLSILMAYYEYLKYRQLEQIRRDKSTGA